MNPILLESVHSYMPSLKNEPLEIRPNSSLFITLPTSSEDFVFTIEFNMDYLYPVVFNPDMMRYLIRAHTNVDFPHWYRYAKQSKLHQYKEYSSQVALYQDFLPTLKDYITHHLKDYMEYISPVIEKELPHHQYYHFLNIEYQRMTNFTQQIWQDIQDITYNRFIPDNKSKIFYVDASKEAKDLTKHHFNLLVRDFYYQHLEHQLPQSSETSSKLKI